MLELFLLKGTLLMMCAGITVGLINALAWHGVKTFLRIQAKDQKEFTKAYRNYYRRRN